MKLTLQQVKLMLDHQHVKVHSDGLGVDYDIDPRVSDAGIGLGFISLDKHDSFKLRKDGTIRFTSEEDGTGYISFTDKHLVISWHHWKVDIITIMKYILSAYKVAPVILNRVESDGRSWVSYPDSPSNEFWVGSTQVYDTEKECILGNLYTLRSGIKQMEYDIIQKQAAVWAAMNLISSVDPNVQR